MKTLLGMVLGERPDAPYDPNRYSPSSGRPASKSTAPPPPPSLAPEGAPDEARRRLYGQGQPDAGAAQEAVPLGPWLLGPSTAGFWTPGGREIQEQTIPLQARTQIAVCSAPLGCGSTAATYENETFMNPWETTQPVLATGQLVNTWTGEVADTYESALPPPNRQAGDVVRERHQQQRRLMAAEGNVNASHRKREQQLPMQAGDAGQAQYLASFDINADVALERNLRGARDIYFNRTELAPCEMEWTRNPFGFEGYNNRLRVLPWQPVTQELENKNWTPNATILPGGERPKQSVRLRADPEQSRRMGNAVTPAVLGEDGRAQVRASLAARDVEGRVDAGRGAAAPVYGDAAPLAAEVRLSSKDSEFAPRPAAGAAPAAVAAPMTVSQESVLKSLDSVRNLPLPSPSRAGAEALGAGGFVAEQRRSARRELEATGAGAVDGAVGAGLTQAQGQALSERDARVWTRGGDVRVDGLGAGLLAAQGQDLGARDAGGASRTGELRLEGLGAFLLLSQQQALGERDAPAVGRSGGGLSAAGAGAGALAVQGQHLGERDATFGAERAGGGLWTTAGAGALGVQAQHLGARDASLGVERAGGGLLTAAGAGAIGAQSQELGAADSAVPHRGGVDLRLPQGSASLGASAVASRRQELYGEALALGLSLPDAASTASAQQAAAPRKLEISAEGRLVWAQTGVDAGLGAGVAGQGAPVRKVTSEPPDAGRGAGREAWAAAAASGSLTQRREERLADHGRRALVAQHDAHGGPSLGEFVLGSEDRAVGARTGGGELAQAAEARSARRTTHQLRQADQPVYRRGYERHGGAQGTDFQQLAPRGYRETTAEVVVQPRANPGSAEGGQRATLFGAREARPARVAKSPFKAQRSFVQDRTRVLAQLSSRSTEVAEG